MSSRRRIRGSEGLEGGTLVEGDRLIAEDAATRSRLESAVRKVGDESQIGSHVEACRLFIFTLIQQLMCQAESEHVREDEFQPDSGAGKECEDKAGKACLRVLLIR